MKTDKREYIDDDDDDGDDDDDNAFMQQYRGALANRQVETRICFVTNV